jgi:hypothetical protein
MSFVNNGCSDSIISPDKNYFRDCDQSAFSRGVGSVKNNLEIEEIEFAY